LRSYGKISVAGGDTATPLSTQKRLRILLEHMPKGNPKVLDCGCGAGDYVRILRQYYLIDAVGIEYLETKVARAKEDSALAPFIHRGNIHSMPYADGTFDMVFLNEVLEHVPNEEKALEEINRVLKQGGILIIFCPNRFYPFESHGVNLKGTQKRIPIFIPFIPYIPVSIGMRIFDYWARNYWPWELRKLVEQNHFSVIDSRFYWQTFENISGQQPSFLRVARSALRVIAKVGEHLPLLRCFGVSQVLVLKRVEENTKTTMADLP